MMVFSKSVNSIMFATRDNKIPMSNDVHDVFTTFSGIPSFAPLLFSEKLQSM